MMITSNLKWKKDSALAEKLHEAFKKDPGPRQHFGGLITDPIPGRLRKLKERVEALELIIKDMENLLRRGDDGTS
jgi:hypothetical protein